MGYPENLRANSGPEDVALFAALLRYSKWAPQNITAFTDDIRQKLINTKQLFPSGSELNFQFEKESTLLENIDLLVTPQALALPLGATFIRYVDYLAMAVVESFTWKYGGNSLQTYYPESDWSKIQFLTDEHKENEQKLALGNLSAATRNTYALAPTPIRIKVPTPWACCRNKAPVIAGLANKLTLIVKFKTAPYFIETDGAKPQTINFDNVHLDYQAIHFTGKVRQEIVSLTMTPQGLSYLFDDIAIGNFPVPANSFGPGKKVTLDLTEFDGPIRKFNIIIRTNAQLDPANPLIAPYEIDTTYLNGLNYRIISNNMDIQDPYDANQDSIWQINKFYNSKYQVLQVEALFEEFPEAQNMASGSLDFANYTAPKLILENPSLLLNPELTVTVEAHRHNWLVHQRGNIQKVWR